MNGVHDMGGMQGMGPIRHEAHEPTFHERWEGRVYALARVLRTRGGLWSLDASPCGAFFIGGQSHHSFSRQWDDNERCTQR